MKLRHYETFYLLHPDLNDEERNAISEKLQKIIVDKQGKIVKVDPWSLRRLAYKVQKQTHGYYVLMEYGASADVIFDVNRELRLNDSVLRFMTSKLNDKFDYEAIMKAYQDKASKRLAEEEADLEAEAVV
ncbi:MAG: 30S ribosomal protein S6 [Dissulfurimicrobium sp.]|uniref:30S ribosomal protein S6 n=1 Tax=Dissulfurimicrobium sp. TaxID=2022436 RepID=UPI00404A13A8